MHRHQSKLAVLLSLALLPSLTGCATGTTMAERMPVAVETLSGLLDRTDEDLAATRTAIQEAKGIGAAATAMLETEHAGMAKGIEGVRRKLEIANRDTDGMALRTAAAEINVLNRTVAQLRRTVMIVEAAAQGK